MGLQLGERGGSQRWEIVGQRTVLAVVGLMLLAGLLGLFGGPGALSSATATGAGGAVRVEYERFLHREADDSITITVDSALTAAETVDVMVAAGWLDNVDLRGISPEPVEQLRSGDGVILRMAVRPGSALDLRISYRPAGLGGLTGWVRVGAVEVSFWQWRYP